MSSVKLRKILLEHQQLLNVLPGQHHTKTTSFADLLDMIADAQAPQFLKLDGSRKAEKIDIDGGAGQYDRIFSKMGCLRVHPTLNYWYFYNRGQTSANGVLFLDGVYMNAFRPAVTTAYFMTGNVDKSLVLMGYLGANLELLRIKNQYVYMANLPTSDPEEVNALWNDAGTIKISSG